MAQVARVMHVRKRMKRDHRMARVLLEVKHGHRVDSSCVGNSLLFRLLWTQLQNSSAIGRWTVILAASVFEDEPLLDEHPQ